MHAKVTLNLFPEFSVQYPQTILVRLTNLSQWISSPSAFFSKYNGVQTTQVPLNLVQDLFLCEQYAVQHATVNTSTILIRFLAYSLDAVILDKVQGIWLKRER